MEFDLPNNSLPWFALFSAQPEKLSQHLLEKTNVANIRDGLAWLMELNKKVSLLQKATPARYCRARMEAGYRAFDDWS